MKRTSMAIPVEIQVIRDKLAENLAKMCNHSECKGCTLNYFGEAERSEEWLFCPFTVRKYHNDICTFVTKEMWIEALTKEDQDD